MKPWKNERRYDMRKDPILACLLNFFMVGTGHIYEGQIWKGLLILAIGIVLWLFIWPAAIPLVIWAMFDAYNNTKKTNQTATKIAADKPNKR
jgi:TM2 domain-containing membrane protein YozV